MHWFTTTDGITFLMMASTLAAAIFTGWNAWETRKAVALSQRALEIDERPYLCFSGGTHTDFEPIKSDDTPKFANIRIPIKNVGRVPAIFSYKEIMVNNVRQEIDSKHTMNLFPGVEIMFSSRNIKLDSPNKRAEIRLEIEYASLTSEKKFLIKRTFDIDLSYREKSFTNYLDDFAN